MEKIVCRKCQSVDDYRTSNSGPHVRADCNQCGSFIKFLPQSFGEDIKFHFGKYAGQRIGDINDKSYLSWAKENLVNVSQQTKEAITNRLTQL